MVDQISPRWGRLKQPKPYSTNFVRHEECGADLRENQFANSAEALRETSDEVKEGNPAERVAIVVSCTLRMMCLPISRVKGKAIELTRQGKGTADERIPETGMGTS